MSGRRHQAAAAVLGQRTLEADHRRLAALLRPGQRVLDVGCGTGSITAGIARRVGPAGRVTGIDRDPALLAQAAAGCPEADWLVGEAAALPFAGAFDVVTAARLVQWIAPPEAAVAALFGAVRPGGLVVVLDYAHEEARWEPAPPPAFQRFYDGFLAWRAAHGWSNDLAHRLPAMFAALGAEAIEVSPEPEFAGPGSAGAAIWTHTMAAVGPAMAAEGFADPASLGAAAEAWGEFAARDLRRQRLELAAVSGLRSTGAQCP